MNRYRIRKVLEEAFAEKFGSIEGTQFFFAPGRVNLIGEHTDYNGGHVFPCALQIGTFALARKREDGVVRYYSVNKLRSPVYEKNITEIDKYNKADRWTNYPNGMIWAFQQNGHPVVNGYDIVIFGNIPVGSGLSSSASLLVLIGLILRTYNHLSNVSNQDLALLAQYAEQKFVGLQCGIMDQFVIAMGKRNHAIYLDTSDLSYSYVPVRLDGITLMIMNTNKRRGLHDSKYNERVEECNRALQDLQKVLSIETLGDLSPEQFETYKHLITDETCRKRARHAVYENARTREAVEVLKRNDPEAFGKLMNASHISLRDDYEVTGVELDTLVESAWKVPGVIGARMTGAGFGGCAVALVKNENVQEFRETVGKAYEEKIGYRASFFVGRIGDGPGMLG